MYSYARLNIAIMRQQGVKQRYCSVYCRWWGQVIRTFSRVLHTSLRCLNIIVCSRSSETLFQNPRRPRHAGLKLGVGVVYQRTPHAKGGLERASPNNKIWFGGKKSIESNLRCQITIGWRDRMGISIPDAIWPIEIPDHESRSDGIIFDRNQRITIPYP